MVLVVGLSVAYFPTSAKSGEPEQLAAVERRLAELEERAGQGAPEFPAEVLSVGFQAAIAVVALMVALMALGATVSYWVLRGGLKKSAEEGLREAREMAADHATLVKVRIYGSLSFAWWTQADGMKKDGELGSEYKLAVRMAVKFAKLAIEVVEEDKDFARALGRCAVHGDFWMARHNALNNYAHNVALLVDCDGSTKPEERATALKYARECLSAARRYKPEEWYNWAETAAFVFRHLEGQRGEREAASIVRSLVDCLEIDGGWREEIRREYQSLLSECDSLPVLTE